MRRSGCCNGEARERILETAEDLFAAGGLDATATAHLARRAAVAKALPLSYLPGKIDLLPALVADRLLVPSLSSIAEGRTPR